MRATVGVLPFVVAALSAPAAEVEKHGQTSVTKLEHVVAGHLTDLNGKYKLRVSEVRYVPSGFIGEHHHAGPGLRCVSAGELTYVQHDKTMVYGPGDCFFESGDMSHTAVNKGSEDVVLLNFEILPPDWQGSSAVPVRKP